MPELVPFAKRIQEKRALLDQMKTALAEALPRHLTADRLTRVVMTDCLAQSQRAKPGAALLVDCTRESFAGAILQCATWGLEPGFGHVALAPFRNNRRGTVECQVILGYPGLIALILNSGDVASIYPHDIKQADRVEFEQGSAPFLKHVPYWGEGDPGPVIGYYAVAHLKAAPDRPIFEIKTRREIEAHRDRFVRAAGEGTPWVEHFDAMAKKTLIKMVGRYLPKSIEAHGAIALDDAAEEQRSQTRTNALGVDWLRTTGDAPDDPEAAHDTGDAPPGGSPRLDQAVRTRRRPPDGQPAEQADLPA